MSATLMRMRHVASVAEGFGSCTDYPTWLDSCGDGCEWRYEELGCVDANFMLFFAALLQMQLVVSVMEAFKV
jgi:hypothetical protein